MLNALSFDIEDWYHIAGLKNPVPFEAWGEQPVRSVPMTRKILDILGESGTRATFFVLGYIAERFPDLLNAIHDHGHELASHGYRHDLITDMSPETFTADLERSRAAIRAAVPTAAIRGFRAPSFSITRDTPWAIEELQRLGFEYDSSVFPVRRADGGMPGAKDSPYRPREGFWEFPISTVSLAGIRLAFSGGGYFRLFPYPFIRACVRRLNREGIPALIYLHPRDFDVETPRLSMPPWKQFKCYVNLGSTEDKLRRLLKDFEFSSVHDILERQS